MTDSLEPTISLIIPVHNGGQAWRACLAALSSLDPQPEEIIIVDDGSSDDSADWAEAAGAARAGMHVERLAAPGGPAAARNHGARLAGSDILFFVDADVALPPGAIGRLGAAFRRWPDAAAVFGSYDDAPAEGNFLSQYKNLLHHHVHQTGREEASTFWAGCGGVRRAVFLALGGFDESYRQPAIEDIELGYRLRRAGYRIRLDKTLQAKHLKRWTVASLLRSDIRQRALPWAELILDEGGFIDDLNVGRAGRLSVAAAYLFVGALPAAVLWPPALAVSAAAALALLAINRPLYAFLLNKRGALFTALALPWHWLYYLYSGLSFAVVVARRRLRAEHIRRAAPQRTAGPPKERVPRHG